MNKEPIKPEGLFRWMQDVWHYQWKNIPVTQLLFWVVGVSIWALGMWHMILNKGA